MRIPFGSRSPFPIAAIVAALCGGPASGQNPDGLRLEPYDFETRGGDVVAAELGRLVVPERRDVDDSRRIELAFARFKSTSSATGFPVVYLAGGPGGSGIELARGPRYPLFAALREFGDVIALDQRGTGLSSPRLDCPRPFQFPADQPGDPEGLLAAYADAARACAAHWRALGTDLDAYNTAESADDLEDLRRALGAEKLQLVAMSYGTHLALAAIRRHGATIDRAVLAGVEGPDHTLKLPMDTQRQLATVSRLLAEDPEVGASLPDLARLVSDTVAQLEIAPRRVATRDALTGAAVEVTIGAFDFQLFTTAVLARRRTIELIPTAFLPIAKGDFSAMASFVPSQMRRESLSAMAGAMDCASGASDARLARIAEEAVSYPLGAAADFPLPGICAAWGVADLGESFRSQVQSDVPALFLSGTLDGRTPVHNAEEVRAGFSNSRHVLVANIGHEDELLVSAGSLEEIRRFLSYEPLLAPVVRLPPLGFGQTVAGGGPPDDASSAIAITHVTLIDGSGAAARPDMTVVVLGRRIVSVEAAATASIPEGARIVDGRGRFLIPGLWDMHVHLSKARGSALALFVANGVTSVRDMGGDFDEIKAWRRAIDADARVGPRILTAGPYLESPANVERMRSEGVVEPVERTRIGVSNPDDARRVVAGLAAEGVDFVKIRTFTDLETYRAIAQAARNEGLTLVGHAAGLSPDDILASGQVSVEHGLFPPLATRPEQDRRGIFARFAQQGVAFVPTAVVALESLLVAKDTAAAVVANTAGEHSAPRRYVSRFLLEDWREQVEEKTEGAISVMKSMMPLMLQDLRELREAGVRILPGTDTAVLLIYPGWSLHDELRLFVDELGMTPLEALRSATRDAAEFMGRAADLGTVAPGKLADLVILGKDPLGAIENTRSIEGVVRNGTYLDREALDRLLEEVLEAPDLRQNDWTTPRGQPVRLG